MPSFQHFNLPTPGMARRLQQELEKDATLSGSSSSVLYVTVRGTECTVVRDAALSVQAEIDAEAAVIAAHAGSPGYYEPNFMCADPPVNGRLLKVQWFETDNGDGTYSGLAKDRVFTYLGKLIIKTVSTTYYKDGQVRFVEIEEYHTTDQNQVVTKNTKKDNED